jgi:hypothetical protein
MQLSTSYVYLVVRSDSKTFEAVTCSQSFLRDDPSGRLSSFPNTHNFFSSPKYRRQASMAVCLFLFQTPKMALYMCPSRRNRFQKTYAVVVLTWESLCVNGLGAV